MFLKHCFHAVTVTLWWKFERPVSPYLRRVLKNIRIYLPELDWCMMGFLGSTNMWSPFIRFLCPEESQKTLILVWVTSTLNSPTIKVFRILQNVNLSFFLTVKTIWNVISVRIRGRTKKPFHLTKVKLVFKQVSFWIHSEYLWMQVG